ncbi:Thioesterase superfamily protein [compost metagenome]
MSEIERTRTYDWESPLDTASKARTLTGLEFLNGMLNGEIAVPPIAKTLDFHLLSIEKGKILAEFTPYEFHYNPIGTVHGGVISTVLDTVMGCALHSGLPQGVAYTTLELKVNFVKAVTIRSGKLLVEGRIIHVGRTTALLEADVKSEGGTLYAHATSTCMIFKP